MREPRAVDHAWFRARLAPYRASLLDDHERGRFEAHARTCADCGTAMKELLEAGPPQAGVGDHIPARLLARWPETRARLRGLPRQLVRQHLSDCTECQADLRAVGYSAAMETDPVLEGSVARPRVPRRARPVVTPLHAWVAGGAAGAALATAATLLVVTLWAPRQQPERVSGTMAPMTRATPFVADVLPPMVALREPMRGAAASETTIRIQPGTRFVHVLLPELYLTDSATVAISVVGPLGQEQVRMLRRYDEMIRQRTLLLGSPDQPLTPGHYSITVATPYSSELPSMELGLTLTH